jgi:cystathionine beta-lyase
MLPLEPNLYQALKVMAAKARGDFSAFAVAASSSAAGGSERSSNGGGASSSGSGSGSGGWKLQTQLLHPAPGSVVDPFDASGAPLYQTATIGQPGATQGGPYDYTRSGNPTRTLLEEQWAALEGGVRGLAYTSGMAALAVVTKLVPSGGHIVAGDDLYGGTSRLLSRVAPSAGVAVSNVDMTDLGCVRVARRGVACLVGTAWRADSCRDRGRVAVQPPCCLPCGGCWSSAAHTTHRCAHT